MEHKSHGSPSFINIAVLLLFAVVIAIASTVTTYYFLSSKTNEQQTIIQPPIVSSVQTNLQPTIPITQTTFSDETVNWKVYKNDVFKFSFKYPPIFTLSDKLSQIRQSKLALGDQDLKLRDNINSMSMTLFATSKGTCCSFGTPFATTKYEVSNTPNKGVIVLKEEKPHDDNCYFGSSDGLPDIECIGIFDPPLNVFNNEYFMWFNYNKDYVNGPIIFKQILSTFKFIE